MRNESRVNMLIAAVLLILLLAACSRNDRFHDLKDYIAKIKQHVKNKLQHKKPQEITEPVPVNYQASGLREPFEDAQHQSIAGRKVLTGANPLLAYPLNVLRLVGTVSQGTDRIAYVMSPNNMVYNVRVGDMIGDHEGKITNILPDRISVTEVFSEDDGKTNTQRISVLKLQGGI